jgi:MoxR-like ATPase
MTSGSPVVVAAAAAADPGGGASGEPALGSLGGAPAGSPVISVDELIIRLAGHRYLAAPSLATVLYLGLRLGKPVLLEGEAGVGKTEVAKVLAAALGRRLIRLQCYEGLDVASALYEWDFARQMLEIRLAEATGSVERGALAGQLYSERFLLRRPLLDALTADPAGPPVLLIDELDRTDEPFEAFLLEILSDFQVSIPELGTVRAPAPPITILTSNRTREIHDALKRRCLYHWIDYPDAERELAILRARAPEVPPRLAAQIISFVHALRASDLFKQPGVAETLDWGHALVSLGCVELDPATVEATLGVLLKYQDDLARITGQPAQRLVEAARGAG